MVVSSFIAGFVFLIVFGFGAVHLSWSIVALAAGMIALVMGVAWLVSSGIIGDSGIKLAFRRGVTYLAKVTVVP